MTRYSCLTEDEFNKLGYYWDDIQHEEGKEFIISFLKKLDTDELDSLYNLIVVKLFSKTVIERIGRHRNE